MGIKHGYERNYSYVGIHREISATLVGLSIMDDNRLAADDSYILSRAMAVTNV